MNNPVRKISVLLLFLSCRCVYSCFCRFAKERPFRLLAPEKWVLLHHEGRRAGRGGRFSAPCWPVAASPLQPSTAGAKGGQRGKYRGDYVVIISDVLPSARFLNVNSVSQPPPRYHTFKVPSLSTLAYVSDVPSPGGGNITIVPLPSHYIRPRPLTGVNF